MEEEGIMISRGAHLCNSPYVMSSGRRDISYWSDGGVAFRINPGFDDLEK